MNKLKSSLVPKVAAILLLAMVAGCLFLLLPPKSAATLGLSRWDRLIDVSGDAGTQLRCWLNRQGVSEYLDLQAPTTIQIPNDVGSVEIRHTGASGNRLDLRIQDQKGESATVSLTVKDQFADLFISEYNLAWSKNRQTVAQLNLKR